MSEEADILSISQFQLAPAILQGQTKEKMITMVSTLQDLIGRLTSLRMQHLFMILASPRSDYPATGLCYLEQQCALVFLLFFCDPLDLIPAFCNTTLSWDRGCLWGEMGWFNVYR
jgi:hypothetical protein